MKKGLIIGKFMPLHLGHIELINFGLNNCDKLVILVSIRKEDSIDGKIRVNWVREVYDCNQNIVVEYMDSNLPNDNRFREKDIIKWCEYIKNRFPDIDVFFSSEKYGDYLASYMGIEHMKFDTNRIKIPISATQIRMNPKKYMEYLPKVVREYYNS